MRIALFTSNQLRHKYIAGQIEKTLGLNLIITEEKSAAIEEDKSDYSTEDSKLQQSHFEQRAASEQLFFGGCSEFPDEVPLNKLMHGSINAQGTLDLLIEHDIDCILLFGTSIIKSIILDKFPNRVVNLHLGLSPYYKGSGTNFFPIVYNEFECLGATIHIATSKVDAGAILHQIRLQDIVEDDTIHSMGNKVIKAAGEVYPKVVAAFLSGHLKGSEQRSIINSRIFRIKDFTPEALKQANKVLLEDGIKNYLKLKSEREALKPIISEFYE